MTSVNEDHTVLPATHTYACTPQPEPQASLHFGWYSFPVLLWAWG